MIYMQDAFCIEGEAYCRHQLLKFGSGAPVILAVGTGLAMPGYTIIVDSKGAADLYAAVINKVWACRSVYLDQYYLRRCWRCTLFTFFFTPCFSIFLLSAAMWSQRCPEYTQSALSGQRADSERVDSTQSDLRGHRVCGVDPELNGVGLRPAGPA